MIPERLTPEQETAREAAYIHAARLRLFDIALIGMTLVVILVSLVVFRVSFGGTRTETVTQTEVQRPSSYEEAVKAWGEPAAVDPEQLGVNGATECGTWAFGGGKVQVFSCR